MIRWTFFFDNENVKSDVTTEEEDCRIADVISNCPGTTLYIPGNNADFYINLKMVKCVLRQIVEEEIPPTHAT